MREITRTRAMASELGMNQVTYELTIDFRGRRSQGRDFWNRIPTSETMVDVGELSGDRVRHDFASLHIGEVSEITKPWINWNQLRRVQQFPQFLGLKSHSHPIPIPFPSHYYPLFSTLKRLFAVFLLANYRVFW